MEAILFLVLAVVLAGVVGFMGYYSIQSLRQASVLGRPVPLDRLRQHMDEPVAVHGQPELRSGQAGPFGFPVLWYQQKNQEYYRRGKSSGWRTTSTRERHFDFYLHYPDGGRVYVSGKPSEVHGGHSRTDGGGFFAYHGQRRTIYKWLPVAPSLTVLGRLALSKQGATILRDKSVGLLWTTAPPASAAMTERLKGWGGLGLCAALVATAVVGFVVIVG